MSHEIHTPTIFDVATGRPILQLGDGGYDGTLTWTPTGFTLRLRHYWHPGQLELSVDRAGDTFRFAHATSAEPLGTLSARVAQHFRGEAIQEWWAQPGKGRQLLQTLVVLSLLLAFALIVVSR